MQAAMWDTLSVPNSLDLRAQNASSESVPIHLLPPELLSEIFIQSVVLSQRGEYPPLPFLGTKIPPFIFCHVCRHWRLVALQTPRLWSSFTIRGKFARSGMVSEAKFWTKLSSSSSLSFFLSIYGKPTEQADHIFNEIAPVLLTHINRWWYANIAARTTNQLEWAATTLPKASETLLDLVITCPDQSDTTNLPFIEFTSYPRLQTLMVDAGVRMSLKYAEMPHLEYLFLTHPITAEEGLRLIKNCPSLRSCNVVFKEWANPVLPEPFEHPSLARLQLQSNNIAEVLHCLHLPKLHTLFLNDNDGPQPEYETPYLNDFCRLSFAKDVEGFPTTAPLTELIINGAIMSDLQVFQGLRYLPELEALTVYSIPLTDLAAHQLGLFDPVSNSVILCPNLKRFTWFGTQGTCSLMIIGSMLSTRWAQKPYVLESVTLQVGPFTAKELEEYPKVKTAVDSGAISLSVTPIRRAIADTAFN